MTDAATGLPVVGMVGGGQLARMTHQAAISLGLGLRVLAAEGTDSAALVSAGVVIGDPASAADVLGFARDLDVLTFDHEHVPQAVLAALPPGGPAVHPRPAALVFAQDKLAMRQRLTALGLPCPRWRAVEGITDIEDFAGQVGWPVVAKAVRGGYDGRGVWVLDDAEQARRLLAGGVALLVEERVDLDRELAVLLARSPSGQAACWPVVETVQRDGVCQEVLAPAPDLALTVSDEATHLALTIAGELDVTGVLAVELFLASDGRLLVNELAMRPHNCGHWTIEGAATSQFAQHVRAVLDWPLGTPALAAPAVAMANLLGGPDPDVAGRLPGALIHHPGVHVHLYGKQPRPGRKLGHVTVLDADLVTARARARACVQELRGSR